MKSSPRANHPSTSIPFHLIGMVFCVCLIIGIPLLLWVYDSWHSEKIFSGITIGRSDVGGKSEEYSEDILREYNDHLQSAGAIFHYGKKSVTIYPQSIPLGSDIPANTELPLFGLDIEKTKNALFAVGRSGTFIQQQHDRFSSALFSHRVDPVVILDSDRLTAALKKEFSFFHSPAHNAKFFFDEHGSLAIKAESSGIEFDYTQAQQNLIRAMNVLTPANITLTEKIVQPDITAQDLEHTRGQAEQILARAPLMLFHAVASDQLPLDQKKDTWHIPSSEIIDWLAPIRASDGTILLALDRQKIDAFLESHIAPAVFVPVKLPRFEMRDGKVSAFEHAQNGQKLDSEKTTHALEQALMQNVSTPIALVIKEQPSPSVDAPENSLAITELLTHAETSFVGSPQNRRKNIARGSSLINGLLIPPDQEFSLIKALGAINDTNGFLPELVIKGNQTKPEFGGGLCQVSTTLFRAVAYAGLNVLERHNHSYRVSYYEPPVGFDATIYDPAPDFRFKNDTHNYVLIQSHIKGSSMIVELWGAKDGRRVEIDKPTVFNIKKPGDTKIIETTDLPPGEKKCTEHAHNGADAFFERRIFYADGTTKKETYKSHYVVWPAVCLVGKKPDEIIDTQPIPDTPSPPPGTPTQSLSPNGDQKEIPPPDTLDGSAP